MARDAEPEFIRYLRDQFRHWAPVEIRRMFGGHAIFRGGTMFALINRETLYLRSDEATRPAFAAAGMGPFRYRRQGRLVALDYHQTPPEALEDSELLGVWADRAYEAALRRAAERAKKPTRKQAKAKPPEGKRPSVKQAKSKRAKAKRSR